MRFSKRVVLSVLVLGLTAVLAAGERDQFLSAKGFFNDGLYSSASSSFKQLLSRYPRSNAREKYHYYLIMSYFYDSQYTRVLFQAKRFAGSHNRSRYLPNVLYFEGEAYYYRGMKQKTEKQKTTDLVQAIASYRRFLKRFKTHKRAAEVAYSIGYTYFQLKRFEAARDRFVSVTQSYGSTSHAGKAYFYLGLIYFNQKKYKEAVHSFRQVTNYKVDAAEKRRAVFKTAQGYFQLGKYSEAINEFNRLKGMLPEKANRDRESYWIAWSLYKLDKKNEALVAFSSIIHSSRRDFYYKNALYRMGIINAEMGRHEPARRYLTRFLKQYPKDELAAGAVAEVGRIDLKTGDRIQLASYLKAFIQRDAAQQAKARAFYLLAKAAVVDKRYNKALTWLKIYTADYADVTDVAKGFYLLGSVYRYKEEWRKAERALQRALSLSKSPEYVHKSTLALGKLYRQRERYLDARKMLSRLLGGDHASAPPARYELAGVYGDKGDTKEAQTHYRAFMDRYAKHELAPAAFYHSAMLRFKEDGAAGLAALERLCRKYPKAEESAWALFDLARIYNDRGETEKGRSRLKRYLKHPHASQKAEAYFNIGMSYFKEYSYGLAARHFLKSYQHPKVSDKLKGRAASLLARTYYNKKDYKQAETFFRRVTDQHKETAKYEDALFGLVETYLVRGKLDRAVAVEKEKLPGSASVDLKVKIYLKLGDELFSRSRFAEAKAYWEKIIAFRPLPAKADEALYKIAKGVYQQNKFKKAVYYLNILVEHVPKSAFAPRALMLLGDSYFMLGSKYGYEKALESYTSLIKRYPDKKALTRKASLNRAECYRRLKKPYRAIREYKQLVKTSDDKAEKAKMRLNIGIEQLKSGKVKEARGNFRAVVSTVKTKEAASAQYYLGVCAERQRDKRRALEEYMKTKYIYSRHHRWVARSLVAAGRILIDQRRYKNAKKVLASVSEYKQPDQTEAARKLLSRLD